MSDRMTDLLRKANPEPDAPDKRELECIWHEVDAATHGAHSLAQQRRKRLKALGATGATVALLSAGAMVVETRTGQVTEPEFVAAGGPGELYRLDGTDLPERLGKLAADIDFPDEATRSKAVEVQLGFADKAAGGLQSTGALNADLARGAICAWGRSWMAADAAGDEATKASSATALREALTWPAVTAVDPQPSMTGYDGDGGPTATAFGPLVSLNQALPSADAFSSTLAETGWCFRLDARPAAGDSSPAAEPEQPEPGTTSTSLPRS